MPYAVVLFGLLDNGKNEIQRCSSLYVLYSFVPEALHSAVLNFDGDNVKNKPNID